MSFEKNDEALKIAIGEKIVRNSAGYQDTLLFKSIDILSQRFTSADNTTPIDSNANYVVVFFYNPKIIDRSTIKNYKNYQKYITEHTKLKIQLFAILNE